MQMFFLKNLVGVSITALILGGISIATIAEQEEKNIEGSMQADEHTAKEQLLIPMPKHEDLSHGLSDDEKAYEEYKEIVELETNPLSTADQKIPEEGTVERTKERLDAILDADKGMDSVNPMDEPAEPSLPPVEEMVPLAPPGNVVPSGAKNQAALTAPTSEAGNPAPDVEAAMAKLMASMSAQEPSSLTSEDTTVESKALMDSQGQQGSVPLQAPTDEATTSAHIQGEAEVIKHNMVLIPISQDGEQSPTKHEDTSPNRLPTSGKGKDKGIKSINPKMIPIIKMGENLTQDSGFTIIKSWDN